jgi:hypothetical protein
MGGVRVRDVAVRRRSAGFYFAGTVLGIAKLQFFVQKLTK